MLIKSVFVLKNKKFRSNLLNQNNKNYSKRELKITLFVKNNAINKNLSQIKKTTQKYSTRFIRKLKGCSLRYIHVVYVAWTVPRYWIKMVKITCMTLVINCNKFS